MKEYTFKVEPMGKPRMTRADAWKDREVVLRYRALCDQLRLLANVQKMRLPDAGIELVFEMPMPESWSMKKRAVMYDQPHQQKPDLDNLVKSVFDALRKDDSTIHQFTTSKVWGYAGCIRIRIG